MKNVALIEAILAWVISLAGVAEGLRLILWKKVHVLYDPIGPGFYVVGLSLALFIAGSVHFIVSRKSISKIAEKPVDRKMLERLISTIGVLAFYLILLDIVGYLLATFIFFLLELRVVGIRSWYTNLILSIVFSTAYYVVFIRLCYLTFPRGIFGFF